MLTSPSSHPPSGRSHRGSEPWPLALRLVLLLAALLAGAPLARADDCAFYPDVDVDYFGDKFATSTVAECGSTIPGYVENKLDCNDANPDVNPGESEAIANGVDNDCNGSEDCYTDADEDTYGITDVVESTDLTCKAPGVANNDDDCDDTDPAITPTGTETPGDNKDGDCNGYEQCYKDNDGDGKAGTLLAVTYTGSTFTCAGAGFASSSSDCVDTDIKTFVGSAEKETNGATTCQTDGDGDGYGSTTAPAGGTAGTDCNDGAAGIHPGATEIVNNGVNEDCAGGDACYADTDGDGQAGTSTMSSTDLDCSDAGEYITSLDCDDSDLHTFKGAAELESDGATTCQTDADGDGYGSGTPPTGGSDGTDCDDDDNTRHPDATEPPGSGIDYNCDTLYTCYTDDDRDGHGTTDTSATKRSTAADCSTSKASLTHDDCDDGEGSVYPGAAETWYDGTDQDCDGNDYDQDEDGYDSDDYGGTDCDDTRATVNTGATEIPANGRSDDCDPFESCYQDADGDGFGGIKTVLTMDMDCINVAFAPNDDDCNDSDANVFPGAAEKDDTAGTRCMRDSDDDGWGDDDVTSPILAGTDCDDSDADISPDAAELEAGDWCRRDQDDDGWGDAYISGSLVGVIYPGQDCDDADDHTFPGAAEEESSTSCMRDGDEDGWGDDTSSSSVTEGSDCDDSDDTWHPDAIEGAGSGLDQNCDGRYTCYQDDDEDGYGTDDLPTATSADATCSTTGLSANATDCNDSQATIYPGAAETVGGGDKDCDSRILCYVDADKDGQGTDARTTAESALGASDCSAPGLSSNANDCLDTSNLFYLGAPEAVCNGYDRDCDDTFVCYVDADLDTYGGTSTVETTDTWCEGVGYSCTDNDPDDGDDTIHPGATEIVGNEIDEDGDGKEICFQDADRDGFRTDVTVASSDKLCRTEEGEARRDTPPDDCDDTKGAVYPGAAELPADGVDQDCDNVDTCFQDYDGDSYGSGTKMDSSDMSCLHEGLSDDHEDCDDTRTDTRPGAGTNETGAASTACVRDQDGDGYGDALATSPVGLGTDCDDHSSAISPADREACNGVDDDCDGTVDESDADGTTTWYRDADGDGFGKSSSTKKGCAAPSGYVADSTDCSDTDPSVNPGADETCNGTDDDCDLVVDEGDAVDAPTWYLDGDEDGFGDPASPTTACNMPRDHVADNTDCDDSTERAWPGAEETCDGMDNDCNGITDEASSSDTLPWYQDADGDSYGDPLVAPLMSCFKPGGHVADATDCDDTQSDVHPAATESCNGQDDNCDGVVDEETASDTLPWYRDQDEDGAGDYAWVTWSCEAPDGYVSVEGGAWDCDDENPAILPGASELPGDAVDQDCDGTETCYVDEDGDGYRVDRQIPSTTYLSCSGPAEARASLPDGDCVDSDPRVHPGVADLDDPDACMSDQDGDGWGDLYAVDPVTPGTDCDDTSEVASLVHPEAEELAGGRPELGPDGLPLPDWSCDGIYLCFTDLDRDGFGSTDTVESDRYDCDEDGASSFSTDCADLDVLAWPGVADQDLDPSLCMQDHDGDGWGDLYPDTGVEPGTDCNDADATIYPTASDLPGDAVDQDCTSDIVCFTDADGDGFGSTLTETVPAADGTATCGHAEGDPGPVDNSQDCDDADPLTWPGAAELESDPAILAGCTRDRDLDGHGDDFEGKDPEEGFTAGTDCEDTQSWSFPGAAELEDLEGCTKDKDGDGYGDDFSRGEAPNPRFVAGTDCYDDEEPGEFGYPESVDHWPAFHPGAPELCEPTGSQEDNDCDGSPNTEGGETLAADTLNSVEAFPDCDVDGYGESSIEIDARWVCDISLMENTGCGWAFTNSDCDDQNPLRYPGAPEACNGRDDDCDVQTDEPDSLGEDAGCVQVFRDHDRDGQGDVETPLCLCLTGGATSAEYEYEMYVMNGEDCDDFDDQIYKREEYYELQDGHDDDCNGEIPVVELDCDDDGYLPLLPRDPGSASLDATGLGLTECNPGDTLETTCFDGNPVPLTCDRTALVWVLAYADSEDAWGGRYQGGRRVYSSSVVPRLGDCDDLCASRSPGQEEVCDGVDNNCSGISFLDVAQDGGLPTTLHGAVQGTVSDDEVDQDADGYLNCTDFSTRSNEVQRATALCGEEYPEPDTQADCNPLCTLTYPNASEVCDGFTNLCLGPQEGSDDDQDRYQTCGAWSSPSADEVPEKVYLVVWHSLGATEGARGPVSPRGPRAETGRGAESGETGTTGETGGLPSYDDSLMIPLILPRIQPGPGGRIEVPCDAHVACADEYLYVALAELVGQTALQNAVCDNREAGTNPLLGLLDACSLEDPSSACSVVEITLSSDVEQEGWQEGTWDREFQLFAAARALSDSCQDEPEQYVTRTVWPASRILAARRLVVEWECQKRFGVPCAQVTEDLPLSSHWADPGLPAGVFSGDLWWMEMERYAPVAVEGATMSCWGDPLTWDITADRQVTGGDCADGTWGANRDIPEGPDDLVGIFNGEAATCDQCVDGIDNNCDGQVDCADPSCAICFVGQGAGCGGGSESPCSGMGCALSSPRSLADGKRLAMITLAALLALGLRRRNP